MWIFCLWHRSGLRLIVGLSWRLHVVMVNFILLGRYDQEEAESDCASSWNPVLIQC